jgi:uncharacterized protein
MPFVIWDASALAKRYTPEVGSDVVQELFANVSASQMVTTVWGYAETFSILLRHRNRSTMSVASFGRAASALENEIIANPDVRFLTVDDTAVLAGISLMKTHNLNSADAAFLSVFLRFARALPPGGPACVLVAADHRLLLAAQAEGLVTLNPESFAAASVPAFLASL